MLERKDVMPVAFLKKEKFTGSLRGMRYRMEMINEGEEETPRLRTAVWPEPYSFDATSEEEKRCETFDFSEEGICEGVKWLNEQYEAGRELWQSRFRRMG